MFFKSLKIICLVCSIFIIGCNNSSSKVTEAHANSVTDTVRSAPVKPVETIVQDTSKTEVTIEEKHAATKPVVPPTNKSKNDTKDQSFKKITGEKSQPDKQSAAASVAEEPDFKKGEMLIAQSDCLACHKLDEKVVGPAFKEVAKKYDGSQKSIDYLAGKIINGGAGVWGEVYMPPHSSVSAEDAKAMTAYILSLK